MTTKYRYLLRRLGGFMLAALLLTGIGVMSAPSAEAQGRHPRRVIIVRTYRPFRPFGPRFGYPYGYYNQYSE